jgi:hypothetical protein
MSFDKLLREPKLPKNHRMSFPLTTMDSPQHSFLLCVVLLVAVHILTWIAWRALLTGKRTDALSKVPGPTVASLTRLWILRHVYGHQLAERCAALAKQYGIALSSVPSYATMLISITRTRCSHRTKSCTDKRSCRYSEDFGSKLCLHSWSVVRCTSTAS